MAIDYNKITETEQMFGGGKTMTLSIALKTLFEVALVAFALWALFNEDKFIAFEERLVAYVRRRRLRVRNSNKNAVVSRRMAVINSNR